MKKCVYVVICVLALLFFVQAKQYSELKISFSPSGESSIQVEGLESKIFVKGELSYSKDTGLFYSGEMIFTVDESGMFPLIKALILMLGVKGELITTSAVIIKTKQNIPIKIAQEIFKPEKVNEYFVYSLPAELALKEKLYFDVKQETEIKIYEIKFDYSEDVKFDFSIDAEFKEHRILEFEMPEIDAKEKDKFIMLRVYFDEDKEVTKVNVIESSFTEEEETALIESIKGAKVINKEEIGEKFLLSYEFVYSKDKEDPHEIKTSGKKEGPVLEGLDLGSIKTKKLVYLLIDDPKDVKNNNVVVNELVKRGKRTIKCLIKATDDKKFQGRVISDN
ncbi:hypothetical protein KAU33_07985 [Candidatus Dependentiae bacterium]|nr:hypothetical protein [Candidatus Dependentiae bacterium]